MADARLELLADSSQIRTAERDLSRLNQTGAATEKNTKRATGAIGSLGRNAGQAGIQVQQFVGQIQGGQGALLALSQQGADLGFVLGQAGLGAAIGITASALSFLFLSAGDATTALDELEDIADTVGKTLEQAADGSDVFSESIQRLAERSESLARVQIAQTIAELEKQLSTSASGIGSAVQDIAGISLKTFNQTILDAGISFEQLTENAFDTSEAVDNLGAGGVARIGEIRDAVSFLSRRFGVSREQAVGLASAISDFQNNDGPVGIARLRSEIEGLETQLGAGNEKFNQFAAALLPFFESSREGVDRINLLRQALGELGPTLDENTESGKNATQQGRDLTASLEGQVIALESGAQAAEVYATVQALVGTEQEGQLPTLIELINRKYELKRAQEEATQAAKDEAAAQRELESDYQQFLRALAQGEQQRINQLESAAGGTSGLTSLQALEQQYETEKELLESAQAEGIQSKISYEDRLTELQKQYSEERARIQQQEQSQQIKFLEDGTSASLSAFAGTLGNLAQIAADAGEESFSTYKALASAQAAIAGSLAVLAVLGDTTITSTTARVALAASIGAVTGAQIAAIQKQEYSGRAVGGSVYSGNSYMVGERGPELFTPNSSGGGRITPFSQLMNEAGGNQSQSNVYVNVQNNSQNSRAEVQESTDAQGNRIIDVVVANIAQRGKIHREMTRTTTASNRI